MEKRRDKKGEGEETEKRKVKRLEKGKRLGVGMSRRERSDAVEEEEKNNNEKIARKES